MTKPLYENIDIKKSVGKSRDVFDALWLKCDKKGMKKDIQRTLQTSFFLQWFCVGFSKN